MTNAFRSVLEPYDRDAQPDIGTVLAFPIHADNEPLIVGRKDYSDEPINHRLVFLTYQVWYSW